MTSTSNVTELFLKVRGKLWIEKEPKLGEEILVKVCVDGMEDRDNHDGSVIRTYKAQLLP